MSFFFDAQLWERLMVRPLKTRPCDRSTEGEFSSDPDPMSTVMMVGHDATPVDLSHRSEILPPQLPEMETRLGPYTLKVLQRIGQGSIIIRGIELGLCIEVALKLLNVHTNLDRDALHASLATEARILAHLHHRSIIRLWHYGEDAHTPFLATEYIEGDDLRVLLRRQKKLDVSSTIHVMHQLIDALEELERLGIIHRDIKPENVLAHASGQVKLIDFGCAIVRGNALPPIQVAFPTMVAVGTPAYMPPEQAKSTGTVDHRADQYSLGMTAYHLLTGRLPFQAKTAHQWILHQIETTPLPPNRINPAIPEPISNWVMQLLNKRPDDRFPTSRAMRHALHQSEREAPTAMGKPLARAAL